jgi:alpha-L-arabinofuranosidase
MTGIERNADIVHMATYAPLFAHVKGWQWRPDMIWFDNLRSMKSVSYYVQQLYCHHKGTNVLPLTMDGKVVAGDEDQNGLFASAVVDKGTGEYIVKVANTSDSDQSLAVRFNGLDGITSARQILLHSDDLDADNTLDEPEKIVPEETSISAKGDVLNVTLKAKTFAVYIVKK